MPARIAAVVAEHGAAGAAAIRPSWCAASWTASPWPSRRPSSRRQRLSGRTVDVVHVVGGGAQNELLCQLTADALRAAGAGRPGRGHRARATCWSRRGTLGAVPARTSRRMRPPGRAAPSELGDGFEPSRRSRVSGPQSCEGGAMRVALLVTCVNDAMFPDTGKAVVTLLRRLGVDVDFPAAQTCCGQPMVNTGYLDEAVPVVRTFVDAFDGVRRGRHAVRVVRRLGPAPARDRGAPLPATPALARRGRAASRRGSTSSASSSSTCSASTDVGAYFPHRVTYHPTCHSLRMLGVGDRPRRLLRGGARAAAGRPARAPRSAAASAAPSR